MSLKAKLGALPDKRAFADEIEARYCEGLRKAGWKGDSQLARFGFVASAGIRCGMMFPKLLEQLTSLNEADDIPDKCKERCMVAVHLLDLAEESIMVANDIGLR